MNIAVAVMHADAIPRVAGDFRHADSVCLFNEVTRAFSLIPLTQLKGRPLTEALLQRQVNALVALSLMPMAIQAFEEAGITCYQAVSTSLEKTINCWPHLLTFRQAGAARPGSCSGTCGTCRESCGTEATHAG